VLSPLRALASWLEFAVRLEVLIVLHTVVEVSLKEATWKRAGNKH